ncbi:hypothetical protein GJ496_001012 [Pomphorhynchus laevis]|nr:hypothetical protein GJ496_001012 [Pomphorhynchus laevis]
MSDFVGRYIDEKLIASTKCILISISDINTLADRYNLEFKQLSSCLASALQDNESALLRINKIFHDVNSHASKIAYHFEKMTIVCNSISKVLSVLTDQQMDNEPAIPSPTYRKVIDTCFKIAEHGCLVYVFIIRGRCGIFSPHNIEYV